MEGRLFLPAEIALSIDVALVEELGMETNVSGLGETVGIAKCSGDGEVGADLGEDRANVPKVVNTRRRRTSGEAEGWTLVADFLGCLIM